MSRSWDETPIPSEPKKPPTLADVSGKVEDLQGALKSTQIGLLVVASLAVVLVVVMFLTFRAGNDNLRQQVIAGNRQISQVSAVLDSIQKHPSAPVKVDSAGIAQLLEQQDVTRALQEQTTADLAQLREEFNRQYLKSK